MRYVSTRGASEPKPFMEILLEGLSQGDGLYVPETYPRVAAHELGAMRGMSYPELAFAVLSKFAGDIPARDLRRIVFDTYTKEVFGTDDIAPLKKLDDGWYLLDLSEGPTLSFKDIALQLLGRLFEYALAKSGGELNILGATSGDTGSAAEYAMRGRKGVRVFMLSPLDRMSEFQRRQMYTLRDERIFNIAVRGTFDDCQDAVKAVNEDAAFKRRYRLGAVNSINWARIAAQVAYYFWGYFRAAASNDGRVAFAVPTGNFGDMLAGHVAREMGLPIGRLILATNENNVLEEFFQTGRYRPRGRSEVRATSSPSMDISKASNFERYVFDLALRDPARVRALWHDLEKGGSFDLSASPEFARIPPTGIVAGSSTHAGRIEAIRAIFERCGAIIDPHTADGVAVGLELREPGAPLICLETALPAKFAPVIREAIGREPPLPERFARLADLPERFEILDPDPAAIKRFVAERS